MAELIFFSGTMDCGKSTLALQMDHNRSARGRHGLVFTRDDRAGRGVLSSRLGLSAAAVEVGEGTDLRAFTAAALAADPGIDYVICDEAQFLTEDQVEQLAAIVDDLGVDVFAFGITTDFRTRLFPGSRRLIELADEIRVMQVETLCWCGARATHNARTVGGAMVVEGEQVVVGDVAPDEEVAYTVLCRRHHRARQAGPAPVEEAVDSAVEEAVDSAVDGAVDGAVDEAVTANAAVSVS